jgi:hypothetical protein
LECFPIDENRTHFKAPGETTDFLLILKKPAFVPSYATTQGFKTAL